MINSLAIVIDCWDNQTYYKNQIVTPEIQQQWNDADIVFNNIPNKIVNTHSIKSVAMVCYCYDRDDNKIVQEYPWWNVGQQFFSHETKWDKLRKEWQSHGVVESPLIHTDQRICNMQLREDQVGFSVFDSLHILYYCNVINPSINNIIYMGQRFDLCVKNRPVGYFHIASLIHHGMFKNDVTVSLYQDCVRFDPNVKIENDCAWTKEYNNVYNLNCKSLINQN